MTIIDDDTEGSGDGRGSREIIGVGCHVGGGTAIDEPVVTYATSSTSGGAAWRACSSMGSTWPLTG
jgi:hypothetical protein